MANEEKKVLLRIELDIKQLTQVTRDASANIKRLVEEQAKIKEGSEAWRINQEEIKLYTKQVADATKAVAIQNKINQEQSGSLNEMRQNLIAAKIEYANLSKEQRNNDDVGGKLQRSILGLNEEIATTEENLGVSTRRVGAYGKEILKLIGVNPTLAKGLGIADKSAAGFNDTLKANPILFVVGLLFQFKDAIVGAGQKVKFVSEIFAAFGNTLTFIKDLLLTVTDAIGITSNALEKSLTKAIEGQAKALEIVTGKLDQQIAVQNALGNETLKIEEQKQNAIRISTQIQIDAMKKLEKAQGQLNDEQKTQLDELVKANTDSVNEIAVVQAKGTKARADEAKKDSDEQKKIAEKRAAELLKARQQFEDTQVQLIKAGIDREVALEKLILARKLEAIKGNSQVENDLRVALKKESDAKIAELQNKNFEDELAKRAEQTKQAVEFELRALTIANQETINKRRELLDAEEAIALNAAGSSAQKIEAVTKEFALRRLELEKENNEKLRVQANENHIARLEGELANLEASKQSTIEKQIEIENEKFRIASENAQLTADERFRIESEHNARIAELHDAEIEEALRLELAKLEIASQLTSALGSLSTIMAESAEDNAEFLKALAVFQIAIDTAKAIVGAVSAAQSVPYPGNLIAIATGVATVLANVVKAKQLLSAKPPKAPKQNTSSAPKAARGMILGGQPHSRGGTEISVDGVPVAEAERGELLAIVNKNSTAMLRGLSNFNKLGGGIDFMKNGGIPEFQSGGIAATTERFSFENGILEAIKKIRPVVAVQHIIDAVDGIIDIEDRARV